MKKSIILIIIFVLTTFMYITCLSKLFIGFYYTTIDGDKYYNSKATENILVLNYGLNIKSVKYCFTDSDECNDYLDYDGNLNRRLLNIAIDYPDSTTGNRICVKITSSNKSSVHCNSDIHVVDSLNPVITPLYNEIILSDIEDGNLEDFFVASSDTGIKKFNCKYINEFENNVTSIECTAIGNNTLTSIYTQTVYLDDYSNLEGKKILFAGDSITEAKSSLDGYKGWAGRVGLGNYMDWYNSGVSGATISKTNRKHITDQIIEYKDGDFDYIILQGGINDMSVGVSLGKIEDSYDVEDFDNTTYAGGLEELFYYTKLYNPDSKIGFIITYKTPNSTLGDAVTEREEWAELTRNICDKWEIPYLDLYDGVVYENGTVKTYSEILQVETGECFYERKAEQVHLGTYGYDVISKYISIWIKTL